MEHRLQEIFGNPQAPKSITEQQFDRYPESLERLIVKPWSQIAGMELFNYCEDLCYVHVLQQNLFDYLFPVLLLRWREGLLARAGGPIFHPDFYYTVYQGQLWTRMMSPTRREEVFSWITDAFIQAVDAWSGHLDLAHVQNGPDNLHFPIWTFNALGQSAPILPAMWPELTNVSTAGRGQWWLTLVSGLVYAENTDPHIPRWTPEGGGGGIYLNESEASIFDGGYLPENLVFLKDHLTVDLALDKLDQSKAVLVSEADRQWAEDLLNEAAKERNRVNNRLNRWFELLAQPDLGGVVDF